MHNKNLPWGGVWIFSGTMQFIFHYAGQTNLSHFNGIITRYVGSGIKGLGVGSGNRRVESGSGGGGCFLI